MIRRSLEINSARFSEDSTRGVIKVKQISFRKIKYANFEGS